MMKTATLIVLFVHAAVSFDIQQAVDETTQAIEETQRERRDVIEEEKYYNIRTENRRDINHQPWLPAPLPPEDPTTRISITNHSPEPFYQTTEAITDKPTGRGARASNDNWVKLPYPNQNDVHREDILTPPKPPNDLINSRMPRVNFVTQNKQLEASESRNDKQAIQRATRTDDLRTEFVRPEEDRTQYKPVYPRQAVYYPEDNRRYSNDRYYAPDDLYRRDPYDLYDRKRYYPGASRADRYDETYDNYVPRKPKRIIYYAHLPEVVRTPPSVDLRYRYSVDPYRRFDDDYSARTGRLDYRFRNRYPYAPVRKDERRFGYRDLAGASTANKDKKIEDKVTPTPILPQKDDKYKPTVNSNRNTINSHQYHDTGDTFNDQLSHKGFKEPGRSDDSYHRFEEPFFHSAVDNSYQRKY
ncbi:uncharacterized protein LOC125050613 [Pieris napi]|uniref:uncharacterized protein LOC125050613 n=1 Tax=Pieris napi TaxID=78633 RepID=UPI001FB8B13A|nr:uncharacterized protein LOC125050613 [Pieris napi]